MTNLPQIPAPRCIHLQSKAMMVHGEEYERDMDYQGAGTDFWCILTGKLLGPDNGEVNLRECCNPERACHQEY